MKKLVALLSVFVLFLAVMPTQAQTPEKKYTLPASQLTAEQLAEIEAAEWEKKMERYGNWVGVGGEIGDAMREGFEALGEFSDTDLGRFTMWLIAWKVVGKDVVRILLGLLFFFLITWLFLKVYRNTYAVKRVAKVRHPFFKRFVKSTEYEIVEPNDDWEGYNAMKFVMLFLYAGAIGITYAIMFA